MKLEKGKILTLIGPNGAGKSTILKSITRQLDTIRGSVYINAQEISEWSPKDMAKQVAVVLTDRIRPELMTCAEVVAMGRYPYTNLFGKLTPKDREAVREALERVHALDLAEQDLTTPFGRAAAADNACKGNMSGAGDNSSDEPTAYGYTP